MRISRVTLLVREVGRMSPRLLRVAMALTEATSIPLLVVGLVYLITGYQMLNPAIVIFPNPRLIHADRLLRIILITLSMIHGYAGLCLMIARRARRVSSVLVPLLTLILLILVLFFTMLELRTMISR